MRLKNVVEFDSNLAAIHAYLCADGYVIKNPPHQKHKYYYIGLRNTNLVLLEDFKKKFTEFFGIVPIITSGKDRCKIQNKELTLKLIETFGAFYSDNWIMPELSKNNLKSWLRAYFDCDGWVGFVEHKDRKIGLDSINLKGLKQIQKILQLQFDIDSSINPRKNGSIWNLSICGKDDLEKFEKGIGFLHPDKSRKLKSALQSYVDLNWKIPHNKTRFVAFVAGMGRINFTRKEVRFNSVIKQNLISLQNKLIEMGIASKLLGPWKNPYGSRWYCLSMKINDFNILTGGET